MPKRNREIEVEIPITNSINFLKTLKGSININNKFLKLLVRGEQQTNEQRQFQEYLYKKVLNTAPTRSSTVQNQNFLKFYDNHLSKIIKTIGKQKQIKRQRTSHPPDNDTIREYLERHYFHERNTPYMINVKKRFLLNNLLNGTQSGSQPNIYNLIRQRYNKAHPSLKQSVFAFMKVLVTEAKMKAEAKIFSNLARNLPRNGILPFHQGATTTSMRKKEITQKNYGQILQNNLLMNSNGVLNFAELQKRIDKYLIIRNIFVEYVHTNNVAGSARLESLDIFTNKNTLKFIKLCVNLFGHMYIETPTNSINPTTSTVVLNSPTGIINNRKETNYKFYYDNTVNEFIIYMNKLLENMPQPSNKRHFKLVPRIHQSSNNNNKYNIKFSYFISILTQLKSLTKDLLNQIVNKLETFVKSVDNLYYKLTIIAKEYRGDNRTLESNLNSIVVNPNTHINKIQKLITSYGSNGSMWQGSSLTPIIPMRLNISINGVYDHEPPSAKIFSDFLNYLRTTHTSIIQTNMIRIFDPNCNFYKNLYDLLINVNCDCEFTPEICRKKLDLCLPRTVIKSRSIYDNSSIETKQILEAYASIIHGIFSHSKVKLGINSRVGTSRMHPKQFESYVSNSIENEYLNFLRREHTISVLKRLPMVGPIEQKNSKIDLREYFFNRTSSPTTSQTDYRTMCILRLQSCPSTR